VRSTHQLQYILRFQGAFPHCKAQLPTCACKTVSGSHICDERPFPFCNQLDWRCMPFLFLVLSTLLICHVCLPCRLDVVLFPGAGKNAKQSYVTMAADCKDLFKSAGLHIGKLTHAFRKSSALMMARLGWAHDCLVCSSSS